MNRRDFLISSTGAGLVAGTPFAAAGWTPAQHHARADKNVTDEAYIPQNLINPPAAQTDNSIALLWDKPVNRDAVKQYHVYVNGRLVETADRTSMTVKTLSPDTSYTFTVRSVLQDGRESGDSNRLVVSTRAKGPVFDITKYGAVGDGTTMNTQAIQKAIDACTPGSTLYFPKGVFMSGALWLKSDMVVHVSEGATLLGSPKAADYPLIMCRYEGIERLCYSSLLNGGELRGDGVENVVITGGGRIDGNGVKLIVSEEKEDNKGARGRVICFRNSRNIYLYNFLETQPAGWNMHFIYCQDVCVNDLRIYILNDEHGNRYPGIHNGNCVTPDSSRNLYVVNTLCASQDDAIDIKSGKDAEGRKVGKPCEHIRVINCRFTSGSGVVVGSEMSGDVRDVLVRDCIFENTRNIGSIKSRRGRGGTVENIRYEDCRLISRDNRPPNLWCRGAINIDFFYGDEQSDLSVHPVDEGTPVFRDITFKNIVLDTGSLHAVYMAGMPECPIRNVMLENVDATGKFGCAIVNVEGLEMKNVSIKVAG